MAQTATPASVSQSGNYAATITFPDRYILENVRQMNLRRSLTQPFYQDLKPVFGDEGAVQSSNTYPFIAITDLSKGAKGDQVTLDKLGRMNSPPIMGDVLVSGMSIAVDWQRDAVKINLFNAPEVNAGGLMSEQRSAHDQEKAAMIQSAAWNSDIEDNLATIMLCGARGYDVSSGWQFPVENDVNLPEMLVNPLLPPTLNRYLVANATNIQGQSGVTSFQAISSSNLLTLAFFDAASTSCQNSPYPMKGVKMSDEKKGYAIGEGMTPTYLVGLTLEQYNSLRTQAIGTGEWNNFVALTGVRDSFFQHPLFNDMQTGRWRNMLFFVYGRPVTFPAGSTTTMYTDSTATTTGTATAAVRIQRGFILGAEAAAIAFGNAKPRTSGRIAKSGSSSTIQKTPYFWHTEVLEGAVLMCYSKMMMGIKKIRFNYGGVPFDAGVTVFDSCQPLNTDFSPV